MPSTNRNLFLQVSGDVSNLQASMKAGRTAILALSDAAGDVQQEVQKALANISADPGALKQLENSYRATFDTIRRNAQASLSANDNGSALNIINASGAEQQAAAAQAQATQLRIAADAAAAVAERQGEAGVAARVLAAALEVQALDAAKVASAMRGQADVLAEVAAEARLAGAREDELGASHNRMGASGMIAEHVVRSLSDSIAAGQTPIRALTMEMGRITEAMTLYAQTTEQTEGVVGKFAGFMGGPWGLAISVAIAVLTPLVTELFEMKDAAEAAKIGNDGLADAQGVLGKMFDLTSGKLEHQNELLRLNARLTAQNLRAEAAKETASSAAALGGAGGSSFAGKIAGTGKLEAGYLLRYLSGGSDFGLIASGQAQVGGNDQVRALAARARAANRLTDEDQRGRALDGVLQAAETTDFSRSTVTKEAFQQAIIDASTGRIKSKIADEIDKSLDSGTLDKGLRNDAKPKKERKPKVDHSAEREANKDRAYQSELNTAQERVAKDQLALSDTAENRLKVELDRLDAAQAQRDLEIGDQVDAKKISEAEAQKLYDLNDEATRLEKQAAVRKEQQDLLDQQLSVDQRILDRKMALLQLQEGVAVGSKAQRALALQQLDAEEQGRRLAANRKIASDDPATQAQGKSDLAAVDEQHQGRVDQINREHADPLQSYGQNLVKNVGDMNDALKGVASDGLKGVEDGLTGIISGTETAAQAFKKMADAIISDLLRIAVEKAVVSVFGFSDGTVGGAGFATGFIPGFASGIIRGPGTGTSDDIPGWMDGVGAIRVSNGESIITAKATRENAPWLRAMNAGLKLPAFATGFVGGSGSIPTSYPALPAANDLRVAPVVHLHNDFRGAVMTQDLLDQMDAKAIEAGQQAARLSVQYTDNRFRNAARRTIGN